MTRSASGFASGLRQRGALLRAGLDFRRDRRFRRDTAGRQSQLTIHRADGASSRERKYIRPAESPATILSLSPNAQHRAGPSHVNVVRAIPDSRSHTLSVLSSDAETTRRPSGLIATPRTEPECPSRVWGSRPVSGSQIFSVLSHEAEATCRPSGVIATPLTP